MKLSEIHASLTNTIHKQRVDYLTRSLVGYNVEGMSYEEMEELHWRVISGE